MTGVFINGALVDLTPFDKGFFNYYCCPGNALYYVWDGEEECFGCHEVGDKKIADEDDPTVRFHHPRRPEWCPCPRDYGAALYNKEVPL